jgi:hypothetical protein
MARPSLPQQGDPAPWGTPLNAHITALGADVDTNTTNIATNTTNTATNTSSISTINTKIANMTTEVETVAAGTAYTLTATIAQVVFGTTSPAIVVPSTGTWYATATLTVNFVGATYAAATDSTLEVKLRNTSTSTDLGQLWKFSLPIGVTTKTAPAGTFVFPVRWVQATASQNVQLWARVVTLPSAGSCTVTAAQINAQRFV